MDEVTAGLAMLAGQLAFTNNQLVTRIKELEAERVERDEEAR